MVDKFNDYIQGLEFHKWVGVIDLSEHLNVSGRTLFQWLKDGKVKGVKSKGRRLIEVSSILGLLLERRLLSLIKSKNKE